MVVWMFVRCMLVTTIEGSSILGCPVLLERYSGATGSLKGVTTRARIVLSVGLAVALPYCGLLSPGSGVVRLVQSLDRMQ